MNIIVTDRESIEAGLLVRTAYVVISIRDPGKWKAAVRKTSGLRETLPAVAAAICKGMGGDDQRFWREYQPNRYVYELVLAANAGSGASKLKAR